MSTARAYRTWVHHREEEPRVRVYVWDALVRSVHWLIAGAIVVLAVTGVYMGRPYQSSVGPASPHFLMGWMKTVHFYAALVFTLALCARVAWFFIGPKQASWRQFIPTTKARWANFGRTLRFYTFLSVNTPGAIAHNSVAGLAYTAVFLLYVVMIVTGFAMYGSMADVRSPMYLFHGLAPWVGGLQTARLIHHVVMWLILAFVVHHVYSALLTSKQERNGELDSIFSGNKFLFREELEAGKDDFGPRTSTHGRT
ncbi:MAG: Ni/Fe-hydrogenase, b-type cytochrome subunit [Myxococcaceae bacterium]